MNFETMLVLAAVFGELAVFALLISKQMWSSFPVFVAFTFWTAISDLTFVVLSHQHLLKTLTPYMYELTADSLLQFAVLAELMRSVVRPIRNSLPKGSFWLIYVLLIVVGVLAWPLASMSTQTNLRTHGQFLLVLNQTVGILRIVFFLLMAGFSQILSIGWRDRELQIASGLGFYASVSLVVAIVHSHGMVGPRYHWLDLVTSLGYLGTLTYWVVCFSIKEPEIRKISPQMQRFLVSIGGTVHADRFALETAIQKKPGKHSHL